MNRIKKIVVVGPESTGKSTLCEKLAQHFNSIWVKEYAREYLLTHGTNYSFENLLDVAQGQLKLEEEGIRLLADKIAAEEAGALSNKFYPLFIDTDQYVMKTWCEFVFGKCHNWILNQVVERKYDLYMLGNVDAPWVKDELREYPDFETRNRLYHHYKDILVNQDTPWIDINGDYEQRLQKAIAAVNELLKD